MTDRIQWVVSERFQWFFLFALFVWVGLLTLDRSRLSEEFRAHSDGIEMLRTHDSADAMGIIRRDRLIQRLEDRIKKLETHPGRRIGDAP